MSIYLNPQSQVPTTTGVRAFWYATPDQQTRMDRRNTIQSRKMPWDDIIRDMHYQVQSRDHKIMRGNSYNRRWQQRHRHKRDVKKMLGIYKTEDQTAIVFDRVAEALARLKEMVGAREHISEQGYDRE